MARIGEFGAALKELQGEKDDFTFFGERFEVQRAMPAVLMLQLGASVSGKVDETEGFAAIWEALRTALSVPAHKRPLLASEPTTPDGMVDVPEDEAPFQRFYKLAVDNSCDLESLMRLVMALFEGQSGRPTQPVSDSAPGPSTTSPQLNGSSTPAAPSHLRSVDELVRGTQPATNSNLIVMGDGQLVEYQPGPAQTG